MKVREYIVKSAQTLNPKVNDCSTFKSFVINKDGCVSTLQSSEKTGRNNKRKSIMTGVKSLYFTTKNVLSDLFLPIGYPESVDETYLRYQIYDSIQGLCSYLRGVICTTAVLSAAGVGNSDVTALSAAVTWALRDGAGMIGGLIFSYMSASHFDSHVKEFRLFADIINDVGLTLDMISPLLPIDKIIYVSAVATVCKVMCGMAAGATKASITAHFAIRGNMADLHAKESTQETLVTLVGMTSGIVLAQFGNKLDPKDAEFWIWVVFSILTGIHVWANYKAVTGLHLNTLNRERTEAILNTTIASCCDHMLEMSKPEIYEKKKGYFKDITILVDIPLPQNVSESIMESVIKLIFPGIIRLGVSLSDTLHGISGDDANWFLTKEFVNDRYILSINRSRNRIYVTMKHNATEGTKLEAFAHAYLIEQFLKTSRKVSKNDTGSKIRFSNFEIIEILPLIAHIKIRSHRLIKRIFAKEETIKSMDENILSLQRLSANRWNCERLYLDFGQYRVDYETKHD